MHDLQQKIDAIHRAVEEGDVRRVRNLIDRPQLAAARDRHGLSPLHKAVTHAQTDTIRFMLIKFPQTVNMVDRVSMILVSVFSVLHAHFLLPFPRFPV